MKNWWEALGRILTTVGIFGGAAAVVLLMPALSARNSVISGCL